MWKKTGAWFFKGLPNYELPTKSCMHPSVVKESPVNSSQKRSTGIHIGQYPFRLF
jgi:hypothetical protein